MALPEAILAATVRSGAGGLLDAGAVHGRTLFERSSPITSPRQGNVLSRCMIRSAFVCVTALGVAVSLGGCGPLISAYVEANAASAKREQAARKPPHQDQPVTATRPIRLTRSMSFDWSSAVTSNERAHLYEHMLLFMNQLYPEVQTADSGPVWKAFEDGTLLSLNFDFQPGGPRSRTVVCELTVSMSSRVVSIIQSDTIAINSDNMAAATIALQQVEAKAKLLLH